MEIHLRPRRDSAPLVSDNLPALVAAAEGINVADFQQAQELSLSRQLWQQRVWGYYDEVGEIHFPARYMANALAKIRLVAAEIVEAEDTPASAGGTAVGAESTNPDPVKVPVPTKNKAVREAVNGLKSPKGGQAGLLRSMCLNLFVTAECFVIGVEAPGGQQWEALSTDELWIQPGQKIPVRRRNPVDTPKPLPEDTLVIRVWVPHPRWSGLADGALRTVMDECEKLLLLTRADKAAARSRFAGAGILFIPNELMPVSQQPAGTSNNTVDAAANPIYQNLIESMIMPIKDESHPSGVVPITIFGPAEYGEKIKYLTFDRPQAARAQQQREESITRIATALDLPAEILTGKADMNHWTAWQVREETFQQHFQPMVELICDALTTGYLKPALIKAGLSSSEADKYLVWYDDSELVVRPDKGETSAALYAENVISAKAWRRETGFSETDAMEPDEYAKRVGLTLLDAQLALTGKPGTATPGSVPTATQPTPPGLPGPTNVAKPPPGKGPGYGGDSKTVADKQKAPDTPNRMSAVTQGTPDKVAPRKPVTASAARRAPRPVGQQLAQLDIELMTQLRMGASEVLVKELERAGAKIRSKAQGDKAQTELLANVPNHLVASVVGPSVVASLGLTDAELMKGAFASFATRAAALFAAAQAARTRIIAKSVDSSDDYNEDFNYDEVYGPQDAANRETGLAILLAGLTAFALKKLYDPAPDSVSPTDGEFDTLLVPGRLVREATAAAGGSIISGRPGTFEPEDFGGIGTGGTTYSMFADNGIAVTSRSWVYGSAIRSPFESHEDLDGLEFTAWDDESLTVRPGDEWLQTEFYHPGDHIGCLCVVAPITSLDQQSDMALDDEVSSQDA